MARMRIKYKKFKVGENHITFFRKKGKDQVKKDIRCIYDGKLLLKQEGEIVLVVEGRVSELENQIEVICERCHSLYIIN